MNNERNQSRGPVFTRRRLLFGFVAAVAVEASSKAGLFGDSRSSKGPAIPRPPVIEGFSLTQDYVVIDGVKYDRSAYEKDGQGFKSAIKSLDSYQVYFSRELYNKFKAEHGGEEFVTDGKAFKPAPGDIYSIQDISDPNYTGILLRHDQTPVPNWEKDGLAVFDGATVEILEEPILIEVPNGSVDLVRVRVESRTKPETGVAALPGEKGYIDTFWLDQLVGHK